MTLACFALPTICHHMPTKKYNEVLGWLHVNYPIGKRHLCPARRYMRSIAYNRNLKMLAPLGRSCVVEDRRLIAIVTALGGLGNIASATNCMTRLRVTVVDEDCVDEAAIKKERTVLGLVHDREAYYEIVVGPGKAKTYANAVRDMLKDAPHGKASANTKDAPHGKASANTKDAQRVQDASSKKSPTVRERLKRGCKILGGIFVPLIPGFIVSGICGSFAMIIQQLVPGYSDSIFWGCLYNLLYLIQQSLLTYLTAWTGYRAAEQFGGTPVLGGMLGMITSMSNINDIATFLGLYNADTPLSSILMTGKGGVLAVVVGVFLMAKVERLVDDHMPDVLKVIGTPLVTMLICTAFYIFAIMPVAGIVASWLCDGMNAVCMSDNMFVRIIAGYIGAAVFLPLVAMGMHHGLVALYAIQLQAIGYVTLYPALCMAGAGQVGAAISIRHKAKKCGNTKVVAVADAGIPAGFLGVGEPLVYSLTLPMGKPFITAGLGAGFGGAFVMFMQVAATAWGPSGLLGLCVMDAGPAGMATSLGSYAIGLLISYVMGFIITNAVVKEEEVAELYRDEVPSEEQVALADSIETKNGKVADCVSASAILHGQVVALDGMVLFAPVDGEVIAQKSIEDETFRDGYLGSCFGITPSEDVVHAPCTGVVKLETDTLHAFVIETDGGQHVMVHVGLDTVNMAGKGFKALVSPGDAVTAGQPILVFDHALVRASGYEDTVITALLKEP